MTYSDEMALHAMIVAALTQPVSAVPRAHQTGKHLDDPMFYGHDGAAPWLSALVGECCGCSWPDQPEAIADVIVDYLRSRVDFAAVAQAMR